MSGMLKKLSFILLILLPGAGFAQTATAANKYIEEYKKEAVEKMNQYGVPASIILGIAMHESGSGTSKISKYLNNHFGMKGSSPNKKIKSSYKGYDSVAASYDDFISLLKNRVQFSKLFDKYSDHDYKSWVLGIQRGGYAKSRTWASQVLGIISKYKLYELDNRPAEDGPAAEIAAPETMQPAKPVVQIYKVKKGDTLLAIARKFGTSVKDIRTKNGLRSTTLQIGQRLRL
jgi:hypothetical protein